VIYRERRRVRRARDRGDFDARANTQALIAVLTAFRIAALQLGGLMIKLGQFLSSRADLLPEQALQVLVSLQDEVPPAPFAHVVSVIERELGKPVQELFSSLDPVATAAASLGQVHRAVLAGSGEQVAVKVQRPDIDRLVAMDLRTLRMVIWLISKFVDTTELIDLMGVYREFRRTVGEELDYVAEAANARRFRELFANRPAIRIPRVHDQYLSKRVLVLEWLDGIKINDYASLNAAGVDHVEAARRTVEAYLYQFFEVGFFHADPHPGNIFIQPGLSPAAPTIAFVDFGMVGRLSKGAKAGLRDLFLGFVLGSGHRMADALHRLGFIGEGANLAAIERAISLMLEEYRGITLGEARDLDMSGVAHEIEDLLYSQPFHIPAKFAFAGRAVGTLSGVTTGLAPDLNLLDVAMPYAQRFLGLTGDGAAQTVEQGIRQLLEAGRTLLAIPGSLDRVLAKLDSGQIEVRLGEPPTGRRGRRGRRADARAAASGAGWLFASISLAAGVALEVEHLPAPGWLCLGLAGCAVLAQLARR
jgi:predicted unusual protein kinase regulating ubiquinone biosynthesis (AarF/ABC1/UbiB family)